MLDEPTIVRILLRDRIRILSYLDSILGDAQLAEDCFQDVCASAVAKNERFEDETHVLRWALRVGRNKSVDLARRRTRQPMVLDEEVLEALQVQWFDNPWLASGAQAEQVDLLRQCLESLTENSRRVVDLRYVDGMKTGRIAELLERKVESVYRTLVRAHVALRECMERKYQQDVS